MKKAKKLSLVIRELTNIKKNNNKKEPSNRKLQNHRNLKIETASKILKI